MAKAQQSQLKTGSLNVEERLSRLESAHNQHVSDLMVHSAPPAFLEIYLDTTGREAKHVVWVSSAKNAKIMEVEMTYADFGGVERISFETITVYNVESQTVKKKYYRTMSYLVTGMANAYDTKSTEA